MSRPPNSTIVFLNLPVQSSSWLMGIDFQFFNLNRVFKGIKSIPDGAHLLHYSEASPEPDTSDKENAASSLRYGHWIECKEGFVHIFFWDEESHRLVMVEQNSLDYSKGMARLGDDYKYMVSYPGDADEWAKLTNMIDLEVIEEYLPTENGSGLVSTIMPSREERIALTEILNRNQPTPGTAAVKEDEEEINYTIIQHDKHRKDRTGQELTDDHFDKSWYLQELYGHDNELLIAELQLAFVSFVAVGSFCSGMQWLSLAKLVSTSKSFLDRSRNFFLTFLGTLHLQLIKLPPELLVDELNLHNQLNIKIYVEVMENFSNIFDNMNGDCCGKMKLNGNLQNIWHNIVATNQKFGIDLKQLKRSVDEENFEVFNLEDYDENDEDMPVIV
ncbi:A1 cistron-splicing factor AAR2 [Meyerozyma sp. JA9]|nr:A1 cistron-splicing factor AAR2 [Meyerozyma sp. JA9]